MSYRGLILDFGGVLTTRMRLNGQAFEKSEGLTPGAYFAALNENPEGVSVYADLEVGRASQEDWNRVIGKILGIDPTDLMRRALANLRPEAAIVNAARRAHEAGIKVAMLSNSFGLEPFNPYAEAALLGQLVAPGGHVWTLDVDQDLVDGARKNLAQAGATNVTVVLGDGAADLPEHAPFDRIQFTVGASDVPEKILDQLAPGGRLILPMRIRGSISRSFAFERDGDTWRTVSCEMATFVPLRKGVCDNVYTPVTMAGEGNVRLETFSEQEVDRDGIRTVLDQPSAKVYSGVKFRQGDPWEWLYLYLAAVLPNGLSRMPGSRPGFTPHFGWGSMAALDDDTLAYLTVREGEDEQGRFWEIGVTGHGSRAAQLADRVAGEIRDWNEGWGNHAPEPGFRMAVGGARDQLTAAEPRFVIDKTHSRLVIDWPRKG